MEDDTNCEQESPEQPEYEGETIHKVKKYVNMSDGAVKIRKWLNKSLKIEMSDGRILIGVFLCTDRDANVILGSCSESLPASSSDTSSNEEPRMLGLVMIPGKHIKSVYLDMSNNYFMSSPLDKSVNSDEVV